MTIPYRICEALQLSKSPFRNDSSVTINAAIDRDISIIRHIFDQGPTEEEIEEVAKALCISAGLPLDLGNEIDGKFVSNKQHFKKHAKAAIKAMLGGKA